MKKLTDYDVACLKEAEKFYLRFKAEIIKETGIDPENFDDLTWDLAYSITNIVGVLMKDGEYSEEDEERVHKALELVPMMS